jgi:hypothetical protein
LVDGLSVVTNDAGAQAIGKLQQQLKDAQTAAGTADASHKAAIDAKDAAIAKIEAERDALKAKVLSDADLDQRVQQRGDLIAKAKAVHDADYSGKTDAEVRKIAVVAKLGDAAVAGKADAYIEARFDILADEAKPVDPVAKALRDSATRVQEMERIEQRAAVATRQAATATEAHELNLQKLLGQINPTVAALNKLAEQEDRLARARDLGLLKPQMWQQYQSQLEGTRAGVLATSNTFGKLNLQAVETQQSLAMLMRALATGNLAQAQSSIASLTARTGVLSTVFSGAGLAVARRHQPT